MEEGGGGGGCPGCQRGIPELSTAFFSPSREPRNIHTIYSVQSIHRELPAATKGGAGGNGKPVHTANSDQQSLSRVQ